MCDSILRGGGVRSTRTRNACHQHGQNHCSNHRCQSGSSVLLLLFRCCCLAAAISVYWSNSSLPLLILMLLLQDFGSLVDAEIAFRHPCCCCFAVSLLLRQLIKLLGSIAVAADGSTAVVAAISIRNCCCCCWCYWSWTMTNQSLIDWWCAAGSSMPLLSSFLQSAKQKKDRSSTPLKNWVDHVLTVLCKQFVHS